MSKGFTCKATGILLCLIITTTHAEESTQFGRYLTTPNKPTQAQLDLLSQTIQVRFPQKVQTVGEAMEYLLKFSGYSLIKENKRETALKETLLKPLPAVDRDFGPMSLKDALTTLIGPAFTLEHDALNRTVDFRLKSQFILSIEAKA